MFGLRFVVKAAKGFIMIHLLQGLFSQSFLIMFTNLNYISLLINKKNLNYIVFKLFVIIYIYKSLCFYLKIFICSYLIYKLPINKMNYSTD